MKWDSKLYDQSQSFVSEYGTELISFIPQNKQQHILDLGCGTGDLSYKLSKISSHVVGVDGSEVMIAKAKEKFPHLHFKVMDACNMQWKNIFDVVFSNAVFHWISDQSTLLAGVHAALKDGGRLVCEFGGSGNIAQIEDAYSNVLQARGIEYKSPFYFPAVEEYSVLLNSSGFSIDKIYDYDRPTPLPDGKAGLRRWMMQFFDGSLSQFKKNEQQYIFGEVEKTLKKDLFDGTKWLADYRRIRVIAHIGESDSGV